MTAEGDILRASEREHTDLFWALRGGGGNFGVVTEFEFRLHPMPGEVHLGLAYWDLGQGTEALRACRDFLAGMPDDMAANLYGLDAPSLDFVPPEYRGVPGYLLLLVSFESAGQVDAALARVRSVPPGFELTTPIPYPALQAMFDENQAWGTFAYEKGLWLDTLSDEVIEIFNAHLAERADGRSCIYIVSCVGEYARVAGDATAFGGPRERILQVSFDAICDDAEDLEVDRGWVREMWARVAPHARNTGGYVNFIFEPSEDRLRESYGPEKYARLAATKAEYDPDNIFHHNQNIKPAPAAR